MSPFLSLAVVFLGAITFIAVVYLIWVRREVAPSKRQKHKRTK